MKQILYPKLLLGFQLWYIEHLIPQLGFGNAL